MAFTRLPYDPRTYAKDLRQRTDPLRYVTSINSTHNCDKCHAQVLTSNNQSQYQLGEVVDIESKLKSLNIPSTNDPIALNKNLNLAQTKTKSFNTCNWYDDYLESSRFTHPVENYRELGIGVERIINLGIEPIVRHYGCFGKNTHLEAIDRHKPCLPNPIDPSNVIPKSKLRKKPNSGWHCEC